MNQCYFCGGPTDAAPERVKVPANGSLIRVSVCSEDRNRADIRNRTE